MKILTKYEAKYVLGAGLIAFGLLLGGCGGSSSSSDDKAGAPDAPGAPNTPGTPNTPTPPNTAQITINGTAAIGSPIVGGTLTAKCAGGIGFTNAVITQANGAWSGTVAAASLPCALQVTGGTPSVTLHSYATQAGVVNVTPLTDLALALATSSVPSDWFNSATPTATLVSGVSGLEQALKEAGFTLPNGSFDPFTTAFDATAANEWDKLLEQLKDAIEADSSIADHAALINLIKDGNLASLPVPVIGQGGNTGNDPLNGVDGATATVSGTRYTYTKSVNWMIGVYRQAVFTATGDNPFAQKWSITGYMVAQDSPKTQPCGNGLILSFANGTDIVEATSCSVTVNDYGTNFVSGSFTAVFPAGDVFTEETTVTDGYFQKIAVYSNGGGGTLASGESGATFKVDGEAYRYVNADAPGLVSLNSDEIYYGTKFYPAFSDQTHPGNPVGMGLSTLPLVADNYSCGHAFTTWRVVNMSFYWKGKSYTPTSCSITLSNAQTDLFEGSFSGTFVADDKTIEVTEGKFRYLLIP